MTFENFLEKNAELVESVMKTENEVTKKFLQVFFQPEFYLYKLSKEMSDVDQATLNGKMAAEALPMVFGGPEVLGILPMDSRDERISNQIKRVEKQKAQSQYFLMNKKELEAQLDLLTLILTNL